jgi:hypothetical protein
MRKFIDIVKGNILTESETLAALAANQTALVSHLTSVMDEGSVQAILEDYDSDADQLADMWFDTLMSGYRFMARQPRIPLYRHIMVEDFETFIEGVKTGAAIGQHWSINGDIESPTWKQDQHGDIPVMITGTIDPAVIDWSSTLEQNFEWPHEGELIFKGGVMVTEIENQDTDQSIKINAMVPR